VQLAQNEGVRADESFKKARDLDPRDAETALAYAAYKIQRGDMDQALATLQDFLRTTPDQPAVTEMLLDLHLKRSDWHSALAVAEQFKAAAPEREQGYFFAGRAYQAKKDYAASIAQFEAALKKNPQSVAPLTAMVVSYVAQRQLARAVSRIKQTLKQFPKLAAAHSILGEVYFAQKRTSDAEAAFRKALQLDPRYVPAISNLANLAMMRSQPGTAADTIKIYQEGITTQGDINLMFALATLYERQKESEQAVLMYEKILAKDSMSAAAANNLAMLLISDKPDAERLSRAKALVERFKSTSSPALLDTVGWVYYMAGDFTLAVSYLNRAVQGLPQVAAVQVKDRDV